MAIAIEKTKSSFLKAAIIAGLVAGAAFLAIEIMMISIFSEEDAWLPVRILASLILGKDVLLSALLFGITNPDISPFYNFGILAIALILHFTISVFFASVIGGLTRVRNMGLALGIGAACGLAIYLINFYGFNAIFPWLEKGRNLISIFAHLIFGMVAAYAFVTIHYPQTDQTHPGAQVV